MEQARAFERLAREFHMTQEQMAVRTGKDRATVANFLRLLRLPASVQAKVETGELSFGTRVPCWRLNMRKRSKRRRRGSPHFRFLFAKQKVMYRGFFIRKSRQKGAETRAAGRSERAGSQRAVAASPGIEGDH